MSVLSATGAVFVWIGLIILAVAIPVVYTIIVYSISNSSLGSSIGDSSDVIPVFAGITSSIASIFMILVWGVKLNHPDFLMPLLFGSVVIITVVQFIISYVQNDVVYANDEVVVATSVIVGIVLSIVIAVFSVFCLVRFKDTAPIPQNVNVEQDVKDTTGLSMDEIKSLKKAEMGNRKAELKAQKKLQKQQKVEQKRIKKQEKKEARRAFFQKYKILILVALIFLIIFGFRFRSSIIEKHISNAAKDIVSNDLDGNIIQNALDTLYEYNAKVSEYSDKIRSIEKKIVNGKICRSWFGRKNRISDLKQQKNEVQEEKKEFEQSNKPELSSAQASLHKLKSSTVKIYSKYRDRLLDQIKIVKNNINDQIKLDEEARKKKLYEQQQDAMNQITKDREKQNASLEEQQKRDKIKREVEELDNTIAVLKDRVNNGEKIDAQPLKNIRNYLNNIKEQRSLINTNDINKIDDCCQILSDLFDRCQNQDEIKVDISLIKSKFNEILK